ncbi:MAG TPA: bifunctional pyr operon transcriptional regulator/uracil phosphoribosyltransferase, partial [Synergistaceae bacterium]|nr:bifunctional pyr operon transcriptional regulator/uracil phosphoribosyltransferase [Synergistaceae bacterium]
MLKEKAKVMNEQEMERALKRMSHEILEKNRGLRDM